MLRKELMEMCCIIKMDVNSQLIGTTTGKSNSSTQLFGLRDTLNPLAKQLHHKVRLVAVLESLIVLALAQQVEFASRY